MAKSSQKAETRVEHIEKIISKKAADVSASIAKQWSRHEALLSDLTSRLNYVIEETRRQSNEVLQLHHVYSTYSSDVRADLLSSAQTQLKDIERAVSRRK